MGTEADTRFPEDAILTGDWTRISADLLIQQLSGAEDVDMILALGLIGSSALVETPDLQKPSIAVFVAAREIQDFPYVNGVTGVKNLVYISSPPSFHQDLETLKNLMPLEKATVLLVPPILEAIPDAGSLMMESAKESGFELRVIMLDPGVEETLQVLGPYEGAVLLPPMLGMNEETLSRLVNGLNNRKIPTFSLFGHFGVEQGVLAGMKPKNDIKRRARRVALNLQRIHLGEDAASIPVDFPLGSTLMLNMATARKIGYHPSWDVLAEADLVEAELPEPSRKVNLNEAVREGIERNLDLAVRDESVAAGFQEIAKSRSRLLPQIEISARGAMIDRDRAAISSGNAPERTLSGIISLDQVIYSEPALADVDIQERNQETRIAERSLLQLDIALATATTYLDILLSQTNLKILRENLKLSSSNLELAAIRQSIGVSGPSETYRWQSQIASDRRGVLEADAQVALSRIALNRLLHHPLEEPFATEENGLHDEALLVSDTRLRTWLKTPWAFGVFRDFAVREGLAAAPELTSINAAIEARERSRQSAEKAFKRPVVTLRAEGSYLLAEGGAGTEYPGVPGGPDEPDDTEWSVGMSMKFPLTTGGKLSAELAQVNADLSSLYLEKASTEEKIDQRIRSALHLAKSSGASIRQARLASEAAGRNMELVTESYTRGVASIAELLDAQTTSLNSKLSSAVSVYNALKDLMEAARAVNNFQFFTSREERDQWLDRLEAQMKQEQLKSEN